MSCCSTVLEELCYKTLLAEVLRLPAPAKASRSSPLESLLKITFDDALGEKRPDRLLGKDKTSTSGWSAVAAAEKLRALPGWLPTKASPMPTTASPKSSPLAPVTGLAVCTTNAYSAGMTCP